MSLSRFDQCCFLGSESDVYLRSLYWWFLVIAVCLLQAGIPGNLQGVVIGSGALWINNNKKINLYHAYPIANHRHDPFGLHQTYMYSSLPETNFIKCGTFDDKIRQYLPHNDNPNITVVAWWCLLMDKCWEGTYVISITLPVGFFFHALPQDLQPLL